MDSRRGGKRTGARSDRGQGREGGSGAAHLGFQAPELLEEGSPRLSCPRGLQQGAPQTGGRQDQGHGHELPRRPHPEADADPRETSLAGTSAWPCPE